MIRRIKSGLSAQAKAENSTQVRGTVESILADIAARGGAVVLGEVRSMVAAAVSADVG